MGPRYTFGDHAFGMGDSNENECKLCVFWNAGGSEIYEGK